MSTRYHVETIERITEQMIEEEVLKETEAIKVDAKKQIGSIKEDSITNINNIKDSAVTEIGNIKDTAVTYISNQKRDVTLALGQSGIRGNLEKIDSDTLGIYNKITTVASDTIKIIKEDIIKMIVDGGYKFKFVNDGNGNVSVQLIKEAI